jgi:hypothetical protein
LRTSETGQAGEDRTSTSRPFERPRASALVPASSCLSPHTPSPFMLCVPSSALVCTAGLLLHRHWKRLLTPVLCLCQCCGFLRCLDALVVQ